MFNLLRETVVRDEQVAVDLVLIPYIIYTIIIFIISELANYNISILNEDIAYGLGGSWIINSIIIFISSSWWSIKNRKKE